ncbi:hypothetical protein BGZ80_009048 [Entomortierella chlamydospora]|uniref:Uncharacterized protein n=1 Tax=Entomortierella chlamydospora TaxID=101097 RepID=A0A9P6MWQ8_9FUNG|nr:hypothetical protein BGZ79_008925 [Entomortierella chlamydospora]KAG0016658.1 hypothetical protein BGZ80_009048 [Entomortierella chlamydospora]
MGWFDLGLDKTLRDGTEVLIGAVFVDEGFAIKPVRDILIRGLVLFVDGSGLEYPTLATSSIAMKCSVAVVLPSGGKRKKGSTGGSRKRVEYVEEFLALGSELESGTQYHAECLNLITSVLTARFTL